MKAPLSYVPVLPATIGYIIGILLYDIVPWYATGAIALCGFGILYAAKEHYISMLVLFIGLGALMRLPHDRWTPPDEYFQQEITYCGEITSTKEYANSKAYIIDIDSINDSKSPYFTIKATEINPVGSLSIGSRVRLKCILTPIDGGTDLPYEVDYNKYLLAQGVVATCLITPEDIKLVERPGRWMSMIDNVRKSLYNSIVMSPVQTSTAGFLAAVLIGDDYLLSDEVYDKYRATGVAHILAISGLHVGIIAMLLTICLFPLSGTLRRQRVKSYLTVILIWSYTLIVGLTPSIVRAAIMLSVFLAARLIQRSYQPFNSLLLSVLIILVVNPLWLYTPGFQLSVSAVAMILMYGSFVPTSLKRYPLAYEAVNIVFIPMAAMLGTGIISAYYFNTVPTLFLLANAAASLLFPLILGFGIAMMLTTLMGLEIPLLGEVTDALYSIMDQMISGISKIDHSQIFTYFSAWVMLPYFLTIIALYLTLRYRKMSLVMMTLIFASAAYLTLILTQETVADEELYVTRGNSSNIIYRQGNMAYLWTDMPDHNEALSSCHKRYEGYLRNRGCEGFILLDTIAREEKPHNKAITISGKSIYYIADTRIPEATERVNYVIVSQHYTGTLSDIVSKLAPDTLLLAPNMHSGRRGKLLREGIATPIHDLRKRGLRIK